MKANLPEIIYLCGFSGSGKTVCGEILADLIGYLFVDTDQVIKSEAGKSIPEIFSGDGEIRFRQIEAEIVRAASNMDKRVISLGGGALTNIENLKFTKEKGTLVYLQASLETINSRLKDSHSRPLLESGQKSDVGNGRIERIETLFKQREKDYLQSGLIIATDGKSPDAVAHEIKDKLSKDA